MTEHAADKMQCMEVWGGNQPVDSGVMMLGLDAWVFNRPYGDAAGGGDVYYVSSCATGRITRLLVADVSGHGASVATIATELRTLMRRFVNYLDQTRFVGELNGRFGELARDGNFATALVATFFAPTNELTICNAGHPPPLLYRVADRSWSALEQRSGAARTPRGPHNLPLGVLELSDYEQFGLRLKFGDMVLCYTDSLIEAVGPDGKALGTEGLLEIVRQVDIGDGTTFIARLLAEMERVAPGAVGQDDVTALLFRPNGSGVRPPWYESFRATGRMLGAIVESLRPGGRPMPWPDWKLANVGGAMFGPLSRFWRSPEALPTLPGKVK